MRRKLLIGAGIVVLLLGLVYVNYSVYPFSADRPNYKDVERVFNKMTFPADWQQIAESENRGIAGRACPIESESACFHRSKTFKIPDQVTAEDVRKVLLQTGCSAVTIKDNRSTSDLLEENTLECSVDGLRVGSDYDRNSHEVYVSVAT